MQAERRAAHSASSQRPRNLILSQIPEHQFRSISRWLIPVELPLGMQLSIPNEPIEHLYFPESGLISIDALTDIGESVEVSIIGREGFSGIAALLGQPQLAHSTIVQGPGHGFRIRASIFCQEFLRGGVLAGLVHNFLYMQMAQSSQSVLCNRLHPVEARMARWILTACDRTQNPTLRLTQEFLAQMLGSRRSTVTVAAGQLQREGLIDYARGRITLSDRPGLEAKSCPCYGIVRATYDRLVGPDY